MAKHSTCTPKKLVRHCESFLNSVKKTGCCRKCFCTVMVTNSLSASQHSICDSMA